MILDPIKQRQKKDGEVAKASRAFAFGARGTIALPTDATGARTVGSLDGWMDVRCCTPFGVCDGDADAAAVDLNNAGRRLNGRTNERTNKRIARSLAVVSRDSLPACLPCLPAGRRRRRRSRSDTSLSPRRPLPRPPPSLSCRRFACPPRPRPPARSLLSPASRSEFCVARPRRRHRYGVVDTWETSGETCMTTLMTCLSPEAPAAYTIPC